MDEATSGSTRRAAADLLKLRWRCGPERAVAVLWATHLCDEGATRTGGDRDAQGKVLTDTTPRSGRRPAPQPSKRHSWR